MQITKAQIKIINTLRSVLKLSEEDYRSRVMGHHKGFGSSSLDLSYSEVTGFIKALAMEARAKGVWQNRPQSTEHKAQTKKYDNLGHRPGMASPAQLRLIEMLWASKSFIHDPAKRSTALRHYCFRITKKSDLTFLESKHASKLIKSIESMKRREA